MVKVEVIEEFTLKKFDELKNIVRAGKEEKGRLFVRDTFECDETMVDYLTGNNPINRAVVKAIELLPDEVVLTEDKTTGKVKIQAMEYKDGKVEVKKKTTTRKTTTKKKTTK